MVRCPDRYWPPVEDVGVQLEEPFNILPPLRQYSDRIYHGINSIKVTARAFVRAPSILSERQRREGVL
jgi:hypothetical protein